MNIYGIRREHDPDYGKSSKIYYVVWYKNDAIGNVNKWQINSINFKPILTLDCVFKKSFL